MSSHFCRCCFTTTTTNTADQLPRTCTVHRSENEEEEEEEEKREQNDKIYDPERRETRLQLRRRKERRATTKNWRPSSQLLQPLTTTISDSPESGDTKRTSTSSRRSAFLNKDVSLLQPALQLMMIHSKSGGGGGPGSDCDNDEISQNLDCGHFITAALHRILNSSVHYHQQQQHCLSYPHFHLGRPANEGNDFQKSKHHQRQEEEKEGENASSTLLLCMMSPRHHQMRLPHHFHPHHYHHQQHQHASLALICLLFSFSSFTVVPLPLDDGCFSFYSALLQLQNCFCLLTARAAVSTAAKAMNINELCHRWWSVLVLVLAVNFVSFFFHIWPKFALRPPPTTSIQPTQVLLHNSRGISGDDGKRCSWITLFGSDDDDLPGSPQHHHQGHLTDQSAPRKGTGANQLTTSHTVNLNNATNGDLFALYVAIDEQLLLLLLFATGGHLSSTKVGLQPQPLKELPPLPLPPVSLIHQLFELMTLMILICKQCWWSQCRWYYPLVKLTLQSPQTQKPKSKLQPKSTSETLKLTSKQNFSSSLLLESTEIKQWRRRRRWQKEEFWEFSSLSVAAWESFNVLRFIFQMFLLFSSKIIGFTTTIAFLIFFTIFNIFSHCQIFLIDFWFCSILLLNTRLFFCSCKRKLINCRCCWKSCVIFFTKKTVIFKSLLSWQLQLQIKFASFLITTLLSAGASFFASSLSPPLVLPPFSINPSLNFRTTKLKERLKNYYCCSSSSLNNCDSGRDSDSVTRKSRVPRSPFSSSVPAFCFFFLLLSTGANNNQNRILLADAASSSNGNGKSLVSVSSSLASTPEHKTYPDLNVLIGHIARLPCDLSTPEQTEQQQPVMEPAELEKGGFYRPLKTTSNPHPQFDPYATSDPVQLVLWYHGADISGSPFYSVDARGTSGQRSPTGNEQHSNVHDIGAEDEEAAKQLKHFVALPYTDRTTFDLNRNNNQMNKKPALLTIQSVRESDAGTYWCRVDFRWTRTTISRVRLNVLVPPKRLSMYRLTPADHRHLFPTALSSTLSSSSGNFDHSTNTAAWQVGQVLASIQSINTSVLSYLPLQLNFSTSSSSSPSSPSTQSYLHMTELSSSVLYLDEGIDTIIGCEAIGGNPLATVSWQRNNRKLIPERVLIRQTATGEEVLFKQNNNSSRKQHQSVPKMASSGMVGPAQNQQKISGSSSNHSLATNELRSPSSSSSISTELPLSELSVLSLVLVDAPTRHDIGALLQCRATNIDAQKPIIRVMKLDVNLRPTKAVIVDMNSESMVAGSTVFVTCLSWGSRPAAKIRWLLRDRPLLDVKETIFESNSTTKSTVRLVLSALDNGAHLRCIAENANSVAVNEPTSSSIVPAPSIESRNPSGVTIPVDSSSAAASSSSASLGATHHQRHHQQQQQQQQSMNAVNNINSNPMAAFDQITLLVKFLPNVTIEAVNADVHQIPSTQSTPPVSSKSNNSKHQPPATIYSLREGATLTLNCHVESNPEPFRIRWLHNRREVQIVTTSTTASSHTGPSLTHHNRTLVVNSVTRTSEGRYQCAVYNALGRGDSKEIGVYVLRPPRCALPPLSVIESSLAYPTNIFCQVDSNPMNDVAIYWQTPGGLILSKDGKIVRRKHNNNPPSQHNGNSLDEFDPETEEDDQEDQDQVNLENDYTSSGHSDGRRLSRLLVASKGVRSRLTIVPQSSADFGLYRCWAENSIGSSRHQEPCLFNLTAKVITSNDHSGSKVNLSVPPRPVHHCVTNYTAAILSVRCLHSNFLVANQTNGGQKLPSSSNHLLQFHLEVHQTTSPTSNSNGNNKHLLVANQTNPLEPTFLVANLQPSSTYQITVYVSSPSFSNSLAVSDKVTMLFETSTSRTSVNIHSSNTSSNISSSSLVLSSKVQSPSSNNNNFDEWLQGGTAFLPTNYGGGGGNDEEVSSSEVNFDLERLEGHQISNSGAGSADQWSPISKPDLQKQNRLGTEQGDNSGSNHRLLVILITVLASSFIVFSVLVSVAIGLCLYRNNHNNSSSQINNIGNKTPSTTSINLNGQQTGDQNTTTTSSKTGTLSKNGGFQEFNGESPVAKICTYQNHHHHHLSSNTSTTTPDLIPCDGSGAGNGGPHLLIFNAQAATNTSDLSSTNSTIGGVAAVAYGGQNNPSLSATVPTGTAIYRDFVSLESSDYTVSSDSSHFQHHQQQQLPQQSITLHTLDALSIGQEPPSSIEPKFLCQPNHVSILGHNPGDGGLSHHHHNPNQQFQQQANHHPFISGQGNVQLLASSSDSSSVLHSSPFHLLTTTNAFLSISPAGNSNGNNLGHYQHHRNPNQNFNQLLFMGGTGEADGNSSFSLSESPSDHASYQHQQQQNQNINMNLNTNQSQNNSHQLSTFTSMGHDTENQSSSLVSTVPTTTVTTADGDLIQATTV